MANEYLKDLNGRDFLREKFINNLLLRGKKSVAERIFNEMINELGDRAKKDGMDVFEKAIENIKPMLEVKSRRIGGSTYQVPIEVSRQRQLTLAFRWLLGFARGRKEKSMSMRLAAELMDAFKKEGNSIKKREDTHKMAEANRAFAHFRF